MDEVLTGFRESVDSIDKPAADLGYRMASPLVEQMQAERYQA